MRGFMRIMSFICVFLASGVVLSLLWVNMLQKENKRLEAEKNGYKIEIQRQQEVIEDVQKRKETVEKLVYKDKEVFDWRADISNTAVVNELRKQCKSCSDSAN